MWQVLQPLVIVLVLRQWKSQSYTIRLMLVPVNPHTVILVVASVHALIPTAVPTVVYLRQSLWGETRIYQLTAVGLNSF